jgi:hypothetical protein
MLATILGWYVLSGILCCGIRGTREPRFVFPGGFQYGQDAGWDIRTALATVPRIPPDLQI